MAWKDCEKWETRTKNNQYRLRYEREGGEISLLFLF